MSEPTTFLAPAKINHFLHVTGQRADGYHLLQTLFQYLDYGDNLEFSINQSGEINRIDNHSYDLPEHDLCTSAANALKQKAKQPNLGVTITLSKRIPPGTGLGAGSSNAATVLLALNKLWQINLPQTELMEIGKTLGADVPIFIYGQSAWAEGIGDQFTLYTPKEQWLCILLPDAQVPTAKIFADPTLDKNHPLVTPQDFLDGNTCNDLQPITIKHYPQVSDALNYLNQFGSAKMSGTGAAVFVAVENQQTAELILNSRPKECSGFVAKGINHHPARELF